MKILLRISATIFFSGSCLLLYAQVKVPATLEIDALTKVIGALFTLAGFFVAYMQLKMANQISEVKIRFDAKLQDVREDFYTKIDAVEGKLQGEIKSEIGKIQTDVRLAQKEIESRMATHHDIANIRALNTLQGEVTNEKLNGLREQLQHAADIATTTAKAAAQAATEAIKDILNKDPLHK